MRVVLAAQEIELKKKNEIADKILAEVRTENAKAETEKAIGTVTDVNKLKYSLLNRKIHYFITFFLIKIIYFNLR